MTLWLMLIIFNGKTGISIADLKTYSTKRECERVAKIENKADFLYAFCVEFQK